MILTKHVLQITDNLPDLDDLCEVQSIIIEGSDVNCIEKKLVNLYSFIVDRMQRNSDRLIVSLEAC